MAVSELQFGRPGPSGSSGGVSNRQGADKFVYIPTTTTLTNKLCMTNIHHNLFPHFDEI